MLARNEPRVAGQQHSNRRKQKADCCDDTNNAATVHHQPPRDGNNQRARQAKFIGVVAARAEPSLVIVDLNARSEVAQDIHSGTNIPKQKASRSDSCSFVVLAKLPDDPDDRNELRIRKGSFKCRTR